MQSRKMLQNVRIPLFEKAKTVWASELALMAHELPRFRTMFYMTKAKDETNACTYDSKGKVLKHKFQFLFIFNLEKDFWDDKTILGCLVNDEKWSKMRKLSSPDGD